MLPGQAIPVFIDGTAVRALIDATADDVLRFWSPEEATRAMERA